MPPVRRSRRLSRRSPMEAADYDWQVIASPQLLQSSPDVETLPLIHLHPPSPSTCTSTSSDSPSPVVTHLPFLPGSSHTRNRKEGYIPRPPNAFMVFRSWLWNKDNLKSVERDNRNVSRIAGRYWNELSEADRAPFRRMAEEAKARHSQLYPEYKYSPTSRKRSKVPHRRSHRSSEDENAKCKKVADLLLGGVVGNDLAKYLHEENVKDHLERGEGATEAPATAINKGPTSALSEAAQKLAKKAKASRKKFSRRPGSYKKLKAAVPPSSLSTHPFEWSDSASVPPPTTEVKLETSETPGFIIGTPGLVYPPANMEEFVAIEEIPYLSLDDCDEARAKKDKEDDDLSLLPSHLLPGAYSVFSGVKPEAIGFVDSCILGAYTTDAQAPPLSFDDTSYWSFMSQGASPFGSPVVFSNPFGTSDPSEERPAVFSPLDQLFGQALSPLSSSPFLTGNW